MLSLGLVSGISLHFFGSSAVRTSDRIVLKAFFFVEFLLSNGEHELNSAVSAGQLSVFHFASLLWQQILKNFSWLPEQDGPRFFKLYELSCFQLSFILT